MAWCGGLGADHGQKHDPGGEIIIQRDLTIKGPLQKGTTLAKVCERATHQSAIMRQLVCRLYALGAPGKAIRQALVPSPITRLYNRQILVPLAA